MILKENKLRKDRTCPNPEGTREGPSLFAAVELFLLFGAVDTYRIIHILHVNLHSEHKRKIGKRVESMKFPFVITTGQWKARITHTFLYVNNF